MQVATISRIIALTAAYFELEPGDLTSSVRRRRLVRARWIAMWLVRTVTQASYPDIGAAFDGFDHSSVIHAVQGVNAWLARGDAPVREAIETLRLRLAEPAPRLPEAPTVLNLDDLLDERWRSRPVGA